MTNPAPPIWPWWLLGLSAGLGIGNTFAHPQAALDTWASVTTFTTNHAIPATITYAPVVLTALAVVLLPIFCLSGRRVAAGIRTLVAALAIITISISGSPFSLFTEALDRLHSRKLPKEERL